MRIYDKRRSGVFFSEHIIFDEWGGILGPLRLVTYLCIVSHAGYKTREGYPSYQTIAHKCDISRRKVIDCVSDLVFLKFLEKERRENKDGDPDSNNYSLLDIPEINGVIAEILNAPDNIPKKHRWIIEKLEAYQALKNSQTLPLNLEPNSTSNNQTKNESSTKINNVEQKGAEGVVHAVHQGSASHALGVVHAVHQGSACHAPEIYTVKEIQIKDTHLHTLTPELLKFDFNLRGLDEAERMYVCNELNKLEGKDSEGRLRDAQTILDEANYKRDRIKLSLAVYVKGLVTKLNKGSFTPTNNLALRRKKKAQEAEKATQAGSRQTQPKKVATAPPKELLQFFRGKNTAKNETIITEEDKQKALDDLHKYNETKALITDS